MAEAGIDRWSLLFRDRAVEREYQLATREQRRAQSAAVFAAVVATMFGMLVADQWALEPGDARRVAWLIRYGIDTPIAVAAAAIAFFAPRTFERFGTVVNAVGVLVLLGSIPAIGVTCRLRGIVIPDAAWIYGLTAMTLAVLTIHALSGMRWTHLTAITVACSAFYLVEQTFWNTEGFGFAAFWLTAANGLAVVASRQSETHRRVEHAQRREIERERERADVAERAGELIEALSRLTGARSTASRARPGALLAEKYRITRKLGAGGMGEVHEVERTADGQRLALKLLKFGASREALLRFAREAQIAAQLNHPNIVRVTDVDVAPSGMFLVMELIDGGTLGAERARFGDPAWAVPMLLQIAEGLAAIHEAGIVHRDLKPANVLIERGIPKIADFGISSLVDDDEIDATGLGDTRADNQELTRTGMILGTPLYMAPELVDGAKDAKPTCDLWSLGVIAYELLAARLPFVEPPFVAAMAGRKPEPAALLAVPGVKAELIQLVSACLAFDPARRPTARDLVHALRPLAGVQSRA